MAPAIESLMKRLYALINPNLDGVQDVSRIFRLPGTINHKPGRNGAVVEVVDLNDRRYTPAEFDLYLPPLPAPTRRERREAAATGNVSIEEVRHLLTFVDPLLPYEQWLEVLMAVHSVYPDQEGFDLCDEWSTEARENAGCNGTLLKQPEKWWQFKRDDAADSITIATLYYYATEGGWEQPKAFTLVERPRPVLLPQWEKPLGAIAPLGEMERPLLLRQLVQYLAPVTVAWREDWADLYALTGLSALLGHLDFGGIKPNLWLLGVSGQSAGKSAAGDVLVQVMKRAAGLGDLTLGLMSEATPQGIQQELAAQQEAGNAGATLLYYSEYSGMLQSLKHEYMAGMKQLLCDLYDGRPFRRRLAREVVEADSPYMALLGSTTLSEFVNHAQAGDFVNGFHSRFWFVAPDYLNVTIERRPNSLECRDMARTIVDHLRALKGVTEVKWSTPFNSPPPAWSALEEELGVNTGEVIRLEDTLSRDDVPPGRILVRVKKVATILAACRDVPRVVDGALLVSDGDVALARRVVLRGAAYARRLASALGGGEEDALGETILRKLQEKGPLTFRELQRVVKRKKEELMPALEILLDDGSVTRTTAGSKQVYALGGEK